MLQGMAHLAVLTAAPGLEIYRDMAARAAAAGHEFSVLDACRMMAGSDGRLWADGAQWGAPVRAVLPRVGNWRPDSTLAVAETLAAAGVALLNAPGAIRVGRDHWRTCSALAAAGIPTPITVAGSDPETLAAAAAVACSFPCVVKQRRSRQGVGVMLCRDRDHLEAVLDSLWRLGDEVVVQRFCPPGGVSRRVLVLHGEPLGGAEHRSPGADFRSNAARGGSLAPVALDAGQQDLAVAAAAALGLVLAGVDLLPDGGDWVVGEVNPSPGWRHFAAATGIPVAARVLAALAAMAEGE